MSIFNRERLWHKIRSKNWANFAAMTFLIVGSSVIVVFTIYMAIFCPPVKGMAVDSCESKGGYLLVLENEPDLCIRKDMVIQ